MSQPSPLPRNLLERSPEESARRLSLAELARAERAATALLAGEDPEALHDFRVALRRLRSTFRAFRAELESSVGKGLRRKLRRLAASTNAGRDAEVALAWLAELPDSERPIERVGLHWLRSKTAQRREAAFQEIERDIARDFPPIAARLREKLSRYRITLALDGERRSTRFADRVRERLDEERRALTERLAAVTSLEDGAPAHAARIAAKRVRYLIEPLTRVAAEAKAPTARLKELQDLLGELRDADLLAAEVVRALEEAEAKLAALLVEAEIEAGGKNRAQRRRRSPRERAGLLAVARAIGERRSALFSRLAERWLIGNAPEAVALGLDLDSLEEAFAQRSSMPAGPDAEERFP